MSKDRISIAFSDKNEGLKKRLLEIANKERRSLNNLIENILTDFVNNEV